MAARFHARSTWVHPAPPITGPLANLARVDTVVIHYPAGNAPDGDPGDLTDVGAYLRAVQRDYMTDPDRGYSIGYSFAIDHTGDVWECRGWDIRPAANAGHNDHTLPLLMIVDQDQPASTAALESARAYVLELHRRTGRAPKIVGHGQLAGAATACPGIGLREQIAAGLFQPTTPGDDTMTAARRVRLRGTLDVFLIGAGPPLHLTPELDAAYADVPLVEVAPHAQFATNLWTQTGLAPGDLWGAWS